MLKNCLLQLFGSIFQSVRKQAFLVPPAAAVMVSVLQCVFWQLEYWRVALFHSWVVRQSRIFRIGPTMHQGWVSVEDMRKTILCWSHLSFPEGCVLSAPRLSIRRALAPVCLPSWLPSWRKIDLMFHMVICFAETWFGWSEDQFGHPAWLELTGNPL